MQTQIQINFADFVQIQETQPVTTSEFIAQAFGKNHKDVLRKIDEILTQVPDFFGKRNFAPTEINRKNNLGFDVLHRAYQLTKDGFMLLVMGFTGKQAMQIKIAYIEAFNAMAEKLKQLSAPTDTRITPAQKQQIREAVDARVARTGETHQGVYKKLHAFCRVNSYHEIQARDFQTALNFLASIPNTPAAPAAQAAPKAAQYINGRRVKYTATINLHQFDDEAETYLVTVQHGKIIQHQGFRPMNAIATPC